MSFEEFLERFKYRFLDYWNSEKRSTKVLSRLGAFALFALVITTIAPTLADELASSPEMLQPITQTETSTAVIIQETATPTASADPTFSPEPQVSRPTIPLSSHQPLPESSDSETANMPGAALEIQPSYTMRIPSSAAIDPRATTYFLPHIYVGVDDPDVKYTLACISGAGVAVDIRTKRSADNSIEGDDLITGDTSGQVLISAETNRVVNLINSYNGAFITSSGGGLAGRSLTFRFVAVTKPVVDPAICSAARNGVITTIRALGLQLSTVKGGGKLK